MNRGRLVLPVRVAGWVVHTEKAMRSPAELLASGLAVIASARRYNPGPMIPLYSSGHDSLCACHVASKSDWFRGVVNMIDTGIGSKASHEHAQRVCEELGWERRVWKSASTYEMFVRDRGFPGPAMHQWAYIRLKERAVRQMIRRRGRVALITGCRKQESVRRMGHVEPVKWGEWENKTDKRTGAVNRVRTNKNRVWVAPCHDWSSDEQAAYMEEHDLPRNPVKIALGMSGECFCGAFASPGELERIRQHCPDVAAEIDRLAGVARVCGTHDKWGTRPSKEKGLVAVESGELCSSCDFRARAAGIVFKA